ADMRGQVRLVDHQQVGPGDAGAALARDLVAARDVDDVDAQVRQLGAEGRGQVVAAALDDDQVQLRELARQAVDGVEVDRRVLDAISSSARSRARSTASGIASPAAASSRCPALWPRGTRRTAALVVASAHANA